MTTRRKIECWLTDMDGVLVHEGVALPGAGDVIKQWQEQGPVSYTHLTLPTTSRV